MISPDLASSEYLRALPNVDVKIDFGADRSAKPRAASSQREERIGVRRLIVGAERTNDTTVVSFAGEIDLVTVEQFKRALAAHLIDGPTIVVIDLTEVTFVSVDGGRVLLTALHQARRRGLVVRLSLSPAARRIITLFDAIDDCEADSA